MALPSPVRQRQSFSWFFVNEKGSCVSYFASPPSNIYSQISSGDFPKPVKLGKKAVGWVEDEIAKYNEAKIAARDNGGA
jgi:predicted DNA-binding transcriptional regulator AlpA